MQSQNNSGSKIISGDATKGQEATDSISMTEIEIEDLAIDGICGVY